jgi:hypothetical protein
MSPNIKQLATAVAGFAPTLASMLGGPLAGMAVTALEGAFGLKSGAGPDAITQIVQSGGMTPETLAAARAADQKHTEIIEQQKIDLAKLNADHETAFAQIDAADREGARGRQVAMKDRTPAHLAYMMIGGFFAICAVQLIAFMGFPEIVTKMPAPAWAIIGNIGGYLAAEAKAASSFYFGDTQGSKTKTEALVDIAKS